ncbi:pogo transposable element with ZNF domain [Trichonephila inaurata madagascariensis]|uniref:Pogo transposable element with ZNF domain n=1 Tax=Trichonephila inaurata madagascariensis TaxID=2747483 RepID=A0A8X6Y2I3_9ARAC|nr:pogo transposable element with ZNF domain [Trichonephila inaurata madagascariensis]
MRIQFVLIQDPNYRSIMGKRKSAKPQKYVQPSEDEDEDNMDFYSETEESENIKSPIMSRQTTVTSEKNIRSLWTKDKLIEPIKKEKSLKDTVESEFWATHLPIHSDGVTSNNKKFDFNTFKTESSISTSSPLETLLSERVFNSNPYLEERLRDGVGLSGTESDRRSGHDLDADRRGSRPKRRRKYVTYPATFRLEVVEHAERFGKNAAAKKYNICVEKVSMWCKTKDNIVHKVKKGGQTSADGSFEAGYDDRMEDMSATGSPEQTMDGEAEESKEVIEDKRQQVSQELEMLYNEESDASDKFEPEPETEVLRIPEVVFPPFFKYRVVLFAEEKGEKEASRHFHVCEKRVAIWCQAKEYLTEYINTHKVEDWECDLYITLKKLLEDNCQVTVRDLIVRAEQAQLTSSSTKSTISTAWLTDWCQKFKVCFRSVIESTPQPLTEHTCLMLETSLFQVDREEIQMASVRGGQCKSAKVQELIDCSRTLDASPSTSDREETISSFSFSSKRRRRSYTLAFKLEVVKFAQSHTKHATSRKYGIARRVISRWIADKEVLQTDLLNATQHPLKKTLKKMLVLGDKTVDFIFTGFRVTKSMLCARANCLFEQQNGARYSRTGGMSATNGWYRHWVVKWKERGEHIDIEEEEATPSSSTAPSVTAGALDLQTTRNSENSSLNALKQAYMTNAILSTMKPNEMDLKIMSQFPELLSVIQQNPSIISAAAQLQCKDSNLYKMCNSSFQAVLNLAKDASPENNSHFPETSLTDKKQPLLNAKKRRERYSPEFKLTVIEYAASHSYQETSRKFGVHHITVSEWCKDKERIRKKVYCENLQSLHTKILKSETAEQKFLSWIQDCNKQKIVIKPSDVQNKASEILSIIGEAEVKKNCWWFYLWNKRGMDPEKIYEEEADVDVLEKESRVNYPPAVKVEIAKVAERQSVNCAARCFRVARKRIREWVKCKDKLKWLAETGQVRERGGSLGGKKINCLDVDKEVYDWYSSSRTPENAPQLSEIRTKALEIFQKHGFSNMKCSKEWYKNWCKRYGICRSLQKDNQLIRWILSRYDKNLPITNQELVEYAISERMKTGVSLNDLPAEEYVFSFCKRYPRLLEALPSIGETFPEEMEAEVTKFRVMIKELQEENNFSTLAIGCMDEIPFLFTNSGSERRVIINSGMSSWNALVILSCLADGTLLPPMIVLKGPEDTLPPEGLKHVVFREKLLADQYVMIKWVNDVWLGNVPSPSMLLMDCFEPHTCSPVQDTMLESGITPVVMPEGCASKLQPLGVCIARNFQESIQDIWSSSRNIAEDYSKTAAGTYPGEIAQCIAAAFERLKDRRDVVRRSFVVTGIAVAPDGSEDALIENADWFGCSGDEHVLSPASDSDRDSDLDAS